MVNKNYSLNNMNDSESDPNKPLSDKELSSLIKASQQSNFNTIELHNKKEQSNEGDYLDQIKISENIL